ncbi:MAG: hypothetical protein RLP44_29650 [Aggregatilineales bacterium]
MDIDANMENQAVSSDVSLSSPSDSTTQTNVEQLVEVNRGTIIGNIGGNFTQNENVYYSSSNNDVLALTTLNTISTATLPTQLDPLFDLLRKNYLVILEAPPAWGHQYVAESLAKRMIDEVLKNKLTDDYEAYKPTGQVTGITVTGALRSRSTDSDNSQTIKNTVIIISDVTPEGYSQEVLQELQQYSQKKNVYTILLTKKDPAKEPKKWEKAFGNLPQGFISLTDSNPYTPEDLTQWVVTRINDDGVSEHLRTLQIIKEDTHVEATTTLHNIDPTRKQITLFQFVTENIHSPGSAAQFSAYVENAKQPADILSAIKSDHDLQLHKWFDGLQNEEERYMVLAVSLINDIPQQTFWAIYEKLIEERWRLRDTNLKMSDYHGIQERLNGYIQITKDQTGKDQIGFRDEDTRKSLISYVLGSYRRSLINALPFIANLIISSDRPPISSSASLTDDLYFLEIWGTDLATRSERLTISQRLRNSLLNSLVEIGWQESRTTEYVLQAWAEQPYFVKLSKDSEFINTTENTMRYKVAFSDTLLRLHRRDTPDPEKSYWESRRSLSLLARWYSTIQQESLQATGNRIEERINALGSQLERNQRRSNIRMTMAFALCELGNTLNQQEEFGHLDGAVYPAENDAEAVSLFEQAPAKLLPIDELNSLWHMLVMLAWEADWRVRRVVARQLLRLDQLYPEYTHKLIFLLAGDPHQQVRIEVAQAISVLIAVHGEPYIQFVHHLLNQNEDQFPQTKIYDDDEHYLYQIFEDARRGLGTKPHLWTATLAMVYCGMQHPNVFRIYLNTMLNDEQSDRFTAFESVFSWLSGAFVSIGRREDLEHLPESFKAIQNIFTIVLEDRGDDARLSKPAEALSNILKRSNRRIPFDLFLNEDEILDLNTIEAQTRATSAKSNA